MPLQPHFAAYLPTLSSFSIVSDTPRQATAGGQSVVWLHSYPAFSLPLASLALFWQSFCKATPKGFSVRDRQGVAPTGLRNRTEVEEIIWMQSHTFFKASTFLKDVA
jgi:hypothetical protein